MIWVLLLLFSCLFVEILMRLPVQETMSDVAMIGKKSSAVLASKNISDHWKEKVFAAYSAKLLKSTILLTSYFLIAVVIVGALIYLVELFDISIGIELTTTTGIIYSGISATLYFFARKSIAGRSI